MVLSNQKRVGFATFAIIATVFIVTRAQVPAPVTSVTRHAFAQKLSLEGVPVFGSGNADAISRSPTNRGRIP